MMKKNNIIITGGTGFIGSNLARKLVKTNSSNVFIIARKSSTYENIEDIIRYVNIYIYSGIINDLIIFFKKIKPKIVFHLAALSIFEHKLEDIDNLIKSNILFGAQLLEAMQKTGIKKIINTGTYTQHFLNEDYNPACLYAATKEAFEKIVEYYVKAENFNAITLKLFDTYGENDKRGKLLNLLSRFAKENKVLKMTPGEQLLDLVYVDDVVDAFIEAYYLLKNKKDIKHEKYGVSSGNLIKLKDLVNLYYEVTGNKVLVDWGG
jgi:nucleoside-diphosphate-sugar epimerase